MSHKTVISLLPISMNLTSSKPVIKPKASSKYSRGKCMVAISDWYINTSPPRRIHYVPAKQNWQLLERGQLSSLIVITTWHNRCLSLGEQEKEELQKQFLFLGSELGKHLNTGLSHSYSVQEWSVCLKRSVCEVNRNTLVFSLMLKGTTFTCHSENTLPDTELGGSLSVKDKGSQLPKASKLSGEEGGTASIPGEEVIAFVVKVLRGKVFLGSFVVGFWWSYLHVQSVWTLLCFFIPCKVH